MAQDSTPMLVAGWHEVVALPDLGIERAFAKLDTGADGSTLHARGVHLLEDGETPMVEFTPPLLRRQESCKEWPGGGVRRVRAPLVDRCVVRSSNGGDETRFIIRTTLRIAQLTFEAEFSLTSREGLRFPVLIGRDALSSRVVVDSGRSHLLD
jgi:hypothetical protein